MAVTVTIAGKKYPIEMRNGVRYINGMTIDAFMETLSPAALAHADKIGKIIIDKGRQPRGAVQKMFNDLHQADNN